MFFLYVISLLTSSPVSLCQVIFGLKSKEISLRRAGILKLLNYKKMFPVDTP